MAALIEIATNKGQHTPDISEWDKGRLTQIESESDSGGEDQGPDELDEDNELHAEAKGATQISYEHQFHQVVDRTIDPSPTL
jgi:hypothetical protein